MISSENKKHINEYVDHLFRYEITPTYIQDKEKLKTEIYALLTPRWFRFRPVEEPIREYINALVSDCVESNTPIRVLDAMGGFKNYRISTAPHIDYAEVFHLDFITKALVKICEIYEPGVRLEYSGDAHMACIVDNLKKEWVDTYIEEFNALLSFVQEKLPRNFKLTHKHFLDFYDLDDMSIKIHEATDKQDLDEQKNKELIEAYYSRAKSNFCVNGYKDYSSLTPAELDEKIKRSVLQAYAWYDLDFEKRGSYFEENIGMCNLSEFPESYCVRSVRYLPAPPFWQGKGVVQIKDNEIIPTILHVNKYVEVEKTLITEIVTSPPITIPTLEVIPILKI